jgi:hypothetical protein
VFGPGHPPGAPPRHVGDLVHGSGAGAPLRPPCGVPELLDAVDGTLKRDKQHLSELFYRCMALLQWHTGVECSLQWLWL